MPQQEIIEKVASEIGSYLIVENIISSKNIELLVLEFDIKGLFDNTNHEF